MERIMVNSGFVIALDYFTFDIRMPICAVCSVDAVRGLAGNDSFVLGPSSRTPDTHLTLREDTIRIKRIFELLRHKSPVTLPFRPIVHPSHQLVMFNMNDEPDTPHIPPSSHPSPTPQTTDEHSSSVLPNVGQK